MKRLPEIFWIYLNNTSHDKLDVLASWMHMITCYENGAAVTECMGAEKVDGLGDNGYNRQGEEIDTRTVTRR